MFKNTKHILQNTQWIKLGGACAVVKSIDLILEQRSSVEDKSFFEIKDFQCVLKKYKFFIIPALRVACAEFVDVVSKFYWPLIHRMKTIRKVKSGAYKNYILKLHEFDLLCKHLKNKIIEASFDMHNDVLEILLQSLQKLELTHLTVKDNLFLMYREYALTKV